MGYIFIILFICLIPPIYLIKSFSNNVRYLLCLIFILLILILRTPEAASDYRNYFTFTQNPDFYGGIKTYSPLFWHITTFLTERLNIESPYVVQIFSIMPVLLISIASLLLSSPISLAYYLSTETFVLLSFNGIRQGISIGFMLLGFSLYFFSLKNGRKNQKLYQFFSLIIILISPGFHSSAFPYLLLLISVFIVNNLIKTFKNLKIKKKTIHNFIFIYFIYIFIFSKRKYRISFMGKNCTYF